MSARSRAEPNPKKKKQRKTAKTREGRKKVQTASAFFGQLIYVINTIIKVKWSDEREEEKEVEVGGGGKTEEEIQLYNCSLLSFG